MSSSRFFIILSGPTAVGKTAALPLFSRYAECEVINADVGQFYEPLCIGTAKPAWRDEPVQHHLFDVMREPENFSVALYRESVLLLMEEIWGRGKVPVIVGGSLFYLKSLFYPPPLSGDRYSQDDHKVWSSTDESLWDQLNRIDPERARRIASTDIYRLSRALDVWERTGIIPSDQRPLFVSPPAPYAFMFFSRERSDLIQRIDQRVIEMMDAGWINEVRNLTPAWRSFLHQKRLIGYSEIEHFVSKGEGGEPVDEQLLVKMIQIKTRQYAKRQMTFWRMLKKDLSVQKEGTLFEINLTLCDLALYIEHVFLCMQSFFAVSGGESNE